MKHTTVILDAGLTLIDATLRRSERFVLLANRWGLSVDAAEATAIHNILWAVYFGDGFPEGDQARIDAMFAGFYRDLLAGLHLPDPDSALAARLVEACDFAKWVQAYPDVKDGLQTLKSRFRLGLLSNAPPTMRPLMHDLGLAGYFHHMTISGEAGVSKPDAAIYRLALAGLGARPEECVFVDDLEENLAAAHALGMACLLIDRRDARPATAYRRVVDLAGVIRELDSLPPAAALE